MKKEFHQVCHDIRWIIWIMAAGLLFCFLFLSFASKGWLPVVMAIASALSFAWAIWAGNCPNAAGSAAPQIPAEPSGTQNKFREGLHDFKLDLLLSQVRLCASETLSPAPEDLETLEELKAGLAELLESTEDPEQRRAFLVRECTRLMDLRVANPKDDAYGLAIQALMDEKADELNRLNTGSSPENA